MLLNMQLSTASPPVDDRRDIAAGRAPPASTGVDPDFSAVLVMHADTKSGFLPAPDNDGAIATSDTTPAGNVAQDGAILSFRRNTAASKPALTHGTLQPSSKPRPGAEADAETGTITPQIFAFTSPLHVTAEPASPPKPQTGAEEAASGFALIVGKDRSQLLSTGSAGELRLNSGPEDAKPQQAQGSQPESLEESSSEEVDASRAPMTGRPRSRAEAPAATRTTNKPGFGVETLTWSNPDGQPSDLRHDVPGTQMPGSVSENAYAVPTPTGVGSSKATGPAVASNVPVAAPDRPVAPSLQLGQALAKIHTGADGSSHLTIRLDPAELGGVQVRISRLHNGAASVSVAVERPETLRSLQNDLGHLHQALDRVGLPGQRSLELRLAPSDTPPQGTVGTGAHSSWQGGSQQGGGHKDRPQHTASGSPGVSSDLMEQIPYAAANRMPADWLRAGVNITA